MRRLAATVSLFAFLSGCAALRIDDADPAAVKVGKGVARVPLAVTTLGMSEFVYARDRAMARWIGKPADRLVSTLGPPDRVVQDHAGGYTMMYSRDRVVVNPGHLMGMMTIPPQKTEWTASRTFRVSADGIITRASWSGL
jgi:hypothetical protein